VSSSFRSRRLEVPGSRQKEANLTTRAEAKRLSDSGARSYREWRDKVLSDPKSRAAYEQELAKQSLWLQLVEARQAAGLTQAQLAKRLGVSQAQVARIEQRGYESYTLKTLQKYVAALGGGLTVTITPPSTPKAKPRRVAAGAR
jgi:DNA-binding XRE family transcriptional regulator